MTPNGITVPVEIQHVGAAILSFRLKAISLAWFKILCGHMTSQLKIAILNVTRCRNTPLSKAGHHFGS